MPNSYEWLVEQKQVLIEIVRQQAGVVAEIQLDKIYGDGEKPGENLGILAQRLKDEHLRVMFMGMFNAGKSTFINALLGTRVLPAKVLPTTAVISMISYGEKQRIIIYPKKGKWKGGDAPFEIRPEELKDYIIIDNESEIRGYKETPFEKMHLFWPLRICRNQIDIVDSPGLNDPDSFETVALGYVNEADAVVYCMNCNMAYSKLDDEAIESLVNGGFRSTLFLLTNYDRIEESAMVNESDEDKEFVRTMKNKLSRFTDLVEDGIFFVDSLHGVLGKERGDEKMLAKSNVLQVEEKLEEYLVGQKGKAKLERGLNQVGLANKLSGEYIDSQIGLGQISHDKLQRKLEEARGPLDSARQKRELIVSKIKLGVTDILVGVEDEGRTFLNGCIDKVPGWVNEYTAVNSISINPLKIKSSVEVISNEYLQQVKTRMQNESKRWSMEVLNPLIGGSVRKTFANMADLIKSYEADIQDLKVELSMGDIGSKMANDQEPGAASRIGSFVFALITQDWVAGGLGMTFGWKGLMRGVGAQVAAIIVVAVASFFTPIGLPAMIIAGIIAAFAGGAWNFMSIKQTIKKKIIEETQKVMRNGGEQEKMLKEIRKSVEMELNKIPELAVRAFNDDLLPLQKAMDDALSAMKKGDQEIEKRKSSLAQLKDSNVAIRKSIKDFAGLVETV